MKIVMTTLDIVGAIVSSKMTGDLRVHFKWILYFFAITFLCAYLRVSP